MLQEQSNRRKYYHALNLISCLGPIRTGKLIRYFGSPEKLWAGRLKSIKESGVLSEAAQEQFIRERETIHLEQAWAELERQHINVLTVEDREYPLRLKEIYAHPLLIYYQGNVELLQAPSLAVVGSRRHTVYGKEMAIRLASALSQTGLTIVSGMARGIDTWAHNGVLEQGGKTVAVLGCGLDICYPPENRLLKEKIREKGLVTSEFPPGTRPLAQNFPRRNRIISGLSLGILVIEAREKSGALITADYALEQGREVFAVPGSVASPYSKGCHRLIKEGAKLVEGVEDILDEISGQWEHNFPASKQDNHKTTLKQRAMEEQLMIKPEEMKLLASIPYEPAYIDEIAAISKVPLHLIHALLLELELKGQVKQLPGNYYLRL